MTTTTTDVGKLLDEHWEDDPGAPGFFSTVDHKRIGKRYFLTAGVFFFLGGIQALLIRMQLFVPESALLDPETYNRLFTMHGTTMIFLFNTPMIAAFGNYLVPLQIGARDMAFPKMNALSYWIYLFAGIFMYGSFLTGDVPDTGWFAYVPLSSADYSPDLALDFWTIGVVFLGISTTIGGINFIVTIFKLRCPGMAISRMPMFTWAILVTGFMIVFALPAITLGPLLVQLDRAFGMAFFDPTRGGDPLLYQHLFWFWGHPEVYILFVPAIGMVSTIIPTFSRRPILGYRWVVVSLVTIGFVSFGVWVHHMFATGVPDMAASFFSAAGFVIAFPTAIQIFAWIGTLWMGRPEWRAPLLWSIGTIVIFVLGGVTGIMVSSVPFDWQATDSYFIVAHLHYVLIGGVVFPFLAGLTYWLPKVTGWMLSERLGQVSFWLAFVGFHVTFFPQHVLGLYGMPRRYSTYPAGLGWDWLNALSTVGAFVFAAGMLTFLAAVLLAWVRRVPAGPNPWRAGGLEWATTSPPADYNFAQIPTVTGTEEPLWEAPHHEGVRAEPGGLYLVEGHQTPESAGLSGRMQAVLSKPHPSYWPFLLAASMFVGSVALLMRALPLGLAAGVAVAGSFLGWHAGEAAPRSTKGTT